jgi:hypothetical protein
MAAATILRMQQLVGNRAVSAWLPAPRARDVVQRRVGTISRQGGVLSDEAAARREEAQRNVAFLEGAFEQASPELLREFVRALDAVASADGERIGYLRVVEVETSAFSGPVPREAIGRLRWVALSVGRRRYPSLFPEEPAATADPEVVRRYREAFRRRAGAREQSWAEIAANVSDFVTRWYTYADAMDAALSVVGWKVSHVALALSGSASVAVGPGTGASAQPLVYIYELETRRQVLTRTIAVDLAAGLEFGVSGGVTIGYRVAPEDERDAGNGIPEWMGHSWFARAAFGLGGQVSVSESVFDGRPGWATVTVSAGPAAFDVGGAAGVSHTMPMSEGPVGPMPEVLELPGR